MPTQVSTACREPGARTRQPSVLSFRGISKRFGAVQANNDISFAIESGGIHAIVGENGAGKSTLTKILYGYYGPDAGSIYLNDRRIVLNSPAQARRAGIGMVHQQLALVQSLSGFENVVLGDPTLPFALNRGNLEKRISEKAHAFGFKFDLSCPVSNLSVAERQKLEIFKLLWRDAHVLILDEPTSQLTPFEAEDVLTIVEGLAASGRIVIFITHHIPEVMRFAKRITVLRKGSCIATVDTDSLDSEDLAGLMVESNELSENRTFASASISGPSLMSLGDISIADRDNGHSLSQINLEIRAGEIIGIAGISGGGQSELGRVIAGLLQPTSGKIAWPTSGACHHDERSRFMGPSLGERVCYIPGDQRQAYAPALSVAANGFLKSVNCAWSHTLGFLKGSLVDQQARQLIDSFEISPALPDLPASALSGGNLQRLIIGRELSTAAKVVVADNPCAGLDAAMAMRVRRDLRRAADTGRGVILISPDLQELITTCDRIIVMFNGRINGEQKSEHFDYQSLALMMGGKQ